MIAINQERGRAANGLTSSELAPSAYNVWAQCLGIETPWENAEQEAWDRIATMSIRIVDDNIVNEASMSAMTFAENLFVIAYGLDSSSRWATASLQEKLAWEGVGRHIINCLDADAGAIDPKSVEPLTLGWFKRKVQENVS